MDADWRTGDRLRNKYGRIGTSEARPNAPAHDGAPSQCPWTFPRSQGQALSRPSSSVATVGSRASSAVDPVVAAASVRPSDFEAHVRDHPPPASAGRSRHFFALVIDLRDVESRAGSFDDMYSPAPSRTLRRAPEAIPATRTRSEGRSPLAAPTVAVDGRGCSQDRPASRRALHGILGTSHSASLRSFFFFFLRELLEPLAVEMSRVVRDWAGPSRVAYSDAPAAPASCCRRAASFARSHALHRRPRGSPTS
jgi:hypothetical protein